MAVSRSLQIIYPRSFLCKCNTKVGNALKKPKIIKWSLNMLHHLISRVSSSYCHFFSRPRNSNEIGQLLKASKKEDHLLQFIVLAFGIIVTAVCQLLYAPHFLLLYFDTRCAVSSRRSLFVTNMAWSPQQERILYRLI